MSKLTPASGEAFLRTKLAALYDVQIQGVSSIEYDPDCPFPYNNLLLDVSWQNGMTEKSGRPLGTQSVPVDVTRAVGRLSNPAAQGLSHENRIENEVAAMSLVRKALQPLGLEYLVPEVYHWESSKDGDQGWMLIERKTGVQVDMIFNEMDQVQKRSVLSQLAKTAAAIQRLQLPAMVGGYGGLTFDSHGQVVSGPMTILPVTSSGSYSAFIRDQLRAHLKDADEHGILTGDLREKMEVLLRSRSVDDLDRHTETLQRTLVPAGFGLGDVLIDPKSLRLTALLDFDFAWVGSKLDSFLAIIDLDRRWLNPDDDEGHAIKVAIKSAVLTGNWQLGIDSTGAGQVAKMWYEALEEEGAMMPSSMTGVNILALLRDLGEELSPVVVCNETVGTGRTDQQKKSDVDCVREAIRRVLDNLLGMRV